MAFLDLPPELIIRVSSFLTTPELGHLRRSCKYVETNLFDNFAREFFTKKQFMLEQVSLEALVDIANHPTLSSRLSEVVIGLQIFPPYPQLSDLLEKKRYDAGHVTHDVLLGSGKALGMLSEAFSKLPNLRTVGLRDYNARGRYRDGDTAVWTSWGWSYSTDIVHHQFVNTASPQSIFPLLLYALGCSKSKPEAVHVFLRRRPKLTANSFNVLDGFMGDKVIPVLQNMKELMLAIDIDVRSNPGVHSGMLSSHEPTETPLRRLLHYTPALETLRLNFESHQYFGPRFLDWLGSPVPGTSTSSPLPLTSVTLPHLKTLELGMFNAPASVLLKVFTKFDLETLSLWKCCLHASSPAASKPNAWLSFLEELSTTLPQSTRLKSVLIGFPSQRCLVGYEDDTAVFFKPSGDDENDSSSHESRSREVRHRAGSGTDIREWFKILSERVIADPKNDDSEMETSEEDDEEDEEDSEDEDDDADD